MKRMEIEISLTFVIIAIVSTIIFGCYSILFTSNKFITFNVLTNAFTVSMWYMIYIWAWTRRHKILAWLGIWGLGAMSTFFLLNFSSTVGISNSEIIENIFSVDGEYAILMILYVISNFVAFAQSEELLEEDKMTNTSKTQINEMDN